jgi:hypothetical protein
MRIDQIDASLAVYCEQYVSVGNKISYAELFGDVEIFKQGFAELALLIENMGKLNLQIIHCVLHGADVTEQGALVMELIMNMKVFLERCEQLVPMFCNTADYKN